MAPDAAGDPERRRWLWVTTVADVDGPGRALSALLSCWPASDDPMAVCALRGVSSAFRHAVPSSIECRDLGMRHLLDARAVARLARFCRAWKPDVVHTQLSRADWLGRTAGRALGIPVVSTLHNLHSRMYGAEFPAAFAHVAAALDRWTMRCADRLVAVSDGVRDDVRRHHHRPEVVVIPNGFDLSRASSLRAKGAVRRDWGIPDNALVAGTVARLKTQKGLPYLIEAARMVCERIPSAHFLVIGDGPLAPDLARRVAGAGLERRFVLAGHVDDPMACLPALDLFVLPSLWEGMPIALLEAMAAGIASVGTQVSGIVDLVTADTGILVPPADPAALAAAIAALLTDRERRERLARAARARAQTFDAAGPAKAYRKLFLDLARQPASSRPVPTR
ncbi:MAG: glycosyltransferase [Acidobacteria bacterium]|nr:glycosyltransferase [Acidobacteriota bacterium]